MKKKTMAFGGLLAAVAMTGYSVAGTYAKYISAVDYIDSARVAKFYLDGADSETAQTIDLFAKSYSKEEIVSKNDDGTTTTKKVVYVNTLENDKVVAPGTKGEVILTSSGIYETAYTIGVRINSIEDMAVYFNLDENNRVINISDTYDETTSPYVYNPITYTIYSVDEDGNHRLYALDADGNFADKTGKPATDKTAEKPFVLNRYYMEDFTATDGSNTYGPEKVTTARNEYALEWKWDTINKVEVEIADGTIVKLKNEDVNKLDTHLGRKGTDTVNVNVSLVAEQVANNHSTKAN